MRHSTAIRFGRPGSFREVLTALPRPVATSLSTLVTVALVARAYGPPGLRVIAFVVLPLFGLVLCHSAWAVG